MQDMLVLLGMQVFLEGLPGFPDGVSATPDGQSFWVAIVAIPSKPALRLMQAPGALSRALRWLCSRLPPQLQPQVEPYGLVVQVSSCEGRAWCGRAAGIPMCPCQCVAVGEL